jgi:glutathione peroxidase
MSTPTPTPIPVSILDIPVERIDGTPTSLAEHQGKVLLIVNVASKCGFTPQYSALEALYEENRDKGLVVCGFPANDFAAQEPGSNDEIRTFCETSFGVKFPLYAKIVATGEQRHPLYSALIASAPETTGDTTEFRKRLIDFGATPTTPPEVLWNFEKFLVARDGTVVKRFATTIAPEDPVLREAVETEISRAS